VEFDVRAGDRPMLRIVDDALHCSKDRCPCEGRGQQKQQETKDHAACKLGTSQGNLTVHENSPASRER
jgi:hypothetical protein